MENVAAPLISLSPFTQRTITIKMTVTLLASTPTTHQLLVMNVP